ncbi:MAG TPA: anthranilate synthase component I family protein [Candidatus Atribacteria bacterium]|nr:anthranilate synthase component I family protein [Candidatus Atribacteria bacterium]
MEIKPDREKFKKLSAEGYDFIPLYAEQLADRLTPVSLVDKFRGETPLILLESAERGEKWGRYSFLIRGGEEVKIEDFTNIISLLEREFASYSVYPEPSLPFLGGAVGFLSYDAVKTWEKTISRRKISYPLAYWIKSNRFLYFDHLKHLLGAVYVARGGEEEDYNQGKKWIEETYERIGQSSSPSSFFATKGEVECALSEEEFREKVEKVRDFIREGHASQVVISQRFSQAFSGDPFIPYRFLRSLNPSPYLFYLETDQFQMAGSSPEMLIKIENGKIFTKPIAGTRKRLSSIPEEEIIGDLLNDEKEIAEHVMLLDLGRSDLGRVCDRGTVQVEKFMDIERYSHVFHIVSTVSGRLAPCISPWRALQASFPAGTVSGAPKVRAMEIIEELEPLPRGPYAGALGYVSLNGNLDTCIIIRSIFFREGKAEVQAGAGIVYDSLPQKEYEETRSKAEALLLALNLAGRGND